jgi:hydrogenase maturation protein HypF
VRNDGGGVAIDVEGESQAVDRFIERLRGEAPPLAVIDRLSVERIAPAGARGFAIAPSLPRGAREALVTPDAATCEDCLRECDDPADRRYRYPFINCTACGPRFTIITDVPYDRPATTMRGFAMCADCAAEYADPADRRFHAQPVACSRCGPTARLLDRAGREVPLGAARDALTAAALALAKGMIVAVKGVGGYQLACRADSEQAVALLRGRKRRDLKPFALMTASLGVTRTLVHTSAAEEALLMGRERPIVICKRRRGTSVAASVAPGRPTLGVMLPASALHHLLARESGGALALTSANLSDEPIIYRDDDALERLGPIADLLLTHDRPIHMRTDDSVVRRVDGATQTIRRARGHVPIPLALPLAAPRAILACGAELKATLCLAKGRHAWISQHIGDLRDAATLRSYREIDVHLRRLFDVTPAAIAHDMHPDYLSSAYAREHDEAQLIAVQHHHAHLAAVLAEHGRCGPAMGLIFDGSGYGEDATSWGGELLLGDLLGFQRAGSLNAVALPGGDAAARQPWRVAASWLAAAHATPGPLPMPLREHVEPTSWRNVGRMIETGLGAPPTSSVGRLFDAVAALCGLCAETSYEGQAAIALEAAIDTGERGVYPLEVSDGEFLTLDARPTIRAVAVDLAGGRGPGIVAARFHNALARAGARACELLRERCGVSQVVLSGGVFQNAALLERTAALLRAARFEVLCAQRVPCNDGGVSYGQAAVAAARLRAQG